MVCAEGCFFSQCYAGAAVCAPSRCALMTGMHMGHSRIRANRSVRGQEHLKPEDVTVAEVMKSARAMSPQLGSGVLVGVEGDDEGKAPLKTDAYLFVTDVDLFTANNDGVFSALISKAGLSVTSVRRLRESFYRRSADLNKHRSRLVRELTRMAARLSGLRTRMTVMP